MADDTITFHEYWWRNAETLRSAVEGFGGIEQAEQAARVAGFPCSVSTVRKWVAQSLPDLEFRQGVGLVRKGRVEVRLPVADNAERLREFISAKKNIGSAFSVEQLADEMDWSPRITREAIEFLRGRGFRIPEDESKISLHRISPGKAKTFKSPFAGQHLRLGVVSDTHLGSNEEALEELHHAYDVFAEQGIQHVYHSGDLVCGKGIYRTQDSEIHKHTFDQQVTHAEENYPKRDGITTHIISGNHDIEGDFGKMGANPVLAVSNRREDFNFLGDWAAWVNIHTEEAPCWLYLLHGKGGMSYAYSYKVQKIVDGFPEERVPDIILPGHWHVRGNFEARKCQVVFPACFEWRSAFMARLGLQPAVGFHILDIHIGDDGRIRRFLPEWFPMRESTGTTHILAA